MQFVATPSRTQTNAAPAIRPSIIDGVSAVPLTAHVDDRGYLIEILRANDAHFTKFGQVYLVGNAKAGTIRAFHKHEELWDWFFISHGAAKFVLEDDRPRSLSYGTIQTIVVSERNPTLVVVPPGVFHGWMSLTDDTQLISTASEIYDRHHPDEVRIGPDSFGDVWTVRGR
jgi:dTDP-4-dehydrorhamnose 3,5-epimerase